MCPETPSIWLAPALGVLLICLASCSDDAGGADGTTDTGPNDTGTTEGWDPDGAPQPNEYSWDGSWTPTSFPVDGLIDETHDTLPPGKWGWDNNCDCPGDEGLSIYENEFVNKGLDFSRLEDAQSHHFGWRLVDTDGGETSLNHRGDNYDGTPGVDLFDLGSAGQLASTGPGSQSPGINFGDGPDMLRYGVGTSVDMRVGDENRGSAFDNDLVILGTNELAPVNVYDISGTTIHTGPGSDLVFARNFGPAAIDMGNGASGRTDALDATDGADMAILQGNMRDFRIYCGVGDDVAVWYVDEVKDDNWLGPNFFGGGGWGEALWGDTGTDRLVLVVDPSTEVVTSRPEHDNNPGSLLVMIYDPYEPTVDGPTEADPFARYYGTAPVGPGGEHTMTLSYRSADGAVFTHDFYATAFEEIQLGVGADAVVYVVDATSGTVSAGADPITALPQRAAFDQLFETFAK